MPIIDPGRVTDVLRSTERGMNSGADPAIIAKNYTSFNVNMTVRGGFPTNRPGIKKLEIDYQGNENLQDGLFQTAAYFKPRGDKACIVASISGRLFRFDLGIKNVVRDISISNIIGGNVVPDYNSAQRRQAWMKAAEDWLFTQDADSRPIFYDGVTTRRAGDGEMKPGAMMEYANGRMVVVRPDRMSFGVGDIVRGPSGTPQYQYRDAILKETENDFLNEGGDFSVPTDAGQINAVKAVAVLDNSTGQGPVQIFTDRAVFSLNIPVDRTTWKDLTFPVQSATLLSNGAVSQDSTLNINGDLWFRSKDGIRSLILGVRDFNQPGNTPISREMNRVIDVDDKRLLGWDTAILFENRLLMGCSQANSFLHGVYHRGLIALDFDIVSSMSDRLPAAYDGLWTGVNVLKLLVGDFDGIDRAFAFVLSSQNKIELWEITVNDPFDNITKPIEWFYETGRMLDSEDLKELKGGHLSIDKLQGRASFNIKFRPDEYSGWIDWHSWSQCAEYQTCTLENCEAPKNLQPQYRADQPIIAPPDGCVTEDDRPAKFGFGFQFRVGVAGAVRIKKLKVHAMTKDESPTQECLGEEECETVDVCNPPVFGYSAEV